jgi:zinc D-Ala-D-Ala carboxypeptidase
VNLSPHFTAAEMTRTSQPFKNEPGPVETQALRTLCEKVLEPIRAHFGPVTVNSPRVNAAVGSKSTSQHAKGEAADIEVKGVTNAALAMWIRDNLSFDQLILESYRPGVAGSGWVHVSYRVGRLRQQSLTMTMGTHGPVYSNGINP